MSPLIGAAVLLLSALGTPAPAEADHGGTTRLSGARAGPYAISAWTRPDRPGSELTVSVSVMRPESWVPVLDAEVRVTAAPIDEGFRDVVSAEAARRGPVLYVADLVLPHPGRWRIGVQVSGSEGEGSAAFDTDVIRPSRWSWRLPGLGVALAVVALLWLSGRRRQGRTNNPVSRLRRSR